MALAPQTGFYFEPLTERLALVVEGAPFPSDDHWAFVGDPIDMSPVEAKASITLRWPGVDPADLEIEFDLNFERAIEAEEAAKRFQAEAALLPREFELDLQQLIDQAELLQKEAAEAAKKIDRHTLEQGAEAAQKPAKITDQTRRITARKKRPRNSTPQK